MFQKVFKQTQLILVMNLKSILFGDNWKFTVNMFVTKFGSLINTEGVNLNILTPKQTIAYLKKTNKSLLRWGDADTRICYKGKIYYQDYREELRDKYLDMLKNYSEKSPFLLAIPSKINLSNKELGPEIRYWFMTKQLFDKYGKKEVPYGDSLLFYSREIGIEDMQELWHNSKGIILIHFNRAVYEYFQTKYPDKKLFYIKVPEKNSFDYLNAYDVQIKDFISANNFKSTDVKIIISAGMLARILGYKLSNEGYTVYDTGVLLGNTENEKNQILTKAKQLNKKIEVFNTPK